ncbi:MAG: hypothetical protein U5K54_12265 [Cytophagales bacterium]|nr:hypothetical protein [Cytophagales bacterium]
MPSIKGYFHEAEKNLKTEMREYYFIQIKFQLKATPRSNSHIKKTKNSRPKVSASQEPDRGWIQEGRIGKSVSSSLSSIDRSESWALIFSTQLLRAIRMPNFYGEWNWILSPAVQTAKRNQSTYDRKCLGAKPDAHPDGIESQSVNGSMEAADKMADIRQ